MEKKYLVRGHAGPALQDKSDVYHALHGPALSGGILGHTTYF
jgi:hypothetical protein